MKPDCRFLRLTCCLQARFGRLLSNPPPQASNAALVPALRVTPRTAKAALRTALADYPSSPALLCCWAALHWRMQHLSALRRSLAEAASAPGMPQQPLVWVLLMQAEARRPGGRHRVHSALESCLAANSPLRYSWLSSIGPNQRVAGKSSRRPRCSGFPLSDRTWNCWSPLVSPPGLLADPTWELAGR